METESHRTVHPLTLSRLKPHLFAFSPDDGGGTGAGSTGGGQGSGQGGETSPPGQGAGGQEGQTGQGQGRELTAEEKHQIAEFKKAVQVETIEALKAHGYEFEMTEQGLDIRKKGQKKETAPQPTPKKDEAFAGYASEMKALFAAEGLEPPTDKELRASYVKEMHRLGGIGAITKKMISEQVSEALDGILARFDAQDRDKWYSGERAFLKEHEKTIDKILEGKGSAKDLDQILKAARKAERDGITKDQTTAKMRQELLNEGFIESSGKGGASTAAPSLSAMQKAKALDADIRKAVAEGKMDNVNTLVSQRRRLYAE